MNNSKIDINNVWRIIGELRKVKDDLPRTPYYIIQRLEEIKSLFPPKKEVESIPVILDAKQKLQSITDDIKSRFQDDEEAEEASVNRKSDIAEKIEKVCIELEVFVKFDSLHDILFKFENRMSEIACIFPPHYFDFRNLIDDLNENILPQTAKTRLTESINYFNEGKFENAIEISAKASELLTEGFVKFIGETSEENWWSNLQKSYKKLSSDSPSDLKWLIWSLLNLHHKMRVGHDTETQQIDGWMDKHRKHMRTTPEWARVSVMCALQAAKEFQELMKIEGLQSNSQ